MAYAGYRIKINNTIFPNHDMAKGSFNITRNPRIARTWKDIQGINHEIYYPTGQTVITFSIREHEPEDHATLAAFFSTRSNVTVYYWDDNADDYRSGTFTIKDIKWKHRTVEATGAYYEATQITLEEN